MTGLVLHFYSHCGFVRQNSELAFLMELSKHRETETMKSLDPGTITKCMIHYCVLSKLTAVIGGRILVNTKTNRRE